MFLTIQLERKSDVPSTSSPIATANIVTPPGTAIFVLFHGTRLATIMWTLWFKIIGMTRGAIASVCREIVDNRFTISVARDASHCPVVITRVIAGVMGKIDGSPTARRMTYITLL